MRFDIDYVIKAIHILECDIRHGSSSKIRRVFRANGTKYLIERPSNDVFDGIPGRSWAPCGVLRQKVWIAIDEVSYSRLNGKIFVCVKQLAFHLYLSNRAFCIVAES